MKHQLEVCRLSPLVIRPYPAHYKQAFAFSNILYPYHIVFALRVTYHACAWNGPGLPVSVNFTVWVRYSLWSGGVVDCV